ncbi:MAG: metallophosphoesterase [archaeon]|nr:metallophosphoesterase [archaeon]
MQAEISLEQRRKEIIDLVSENNLIIELRAVEMLSKEDSYKNFIQEFVQEQKFVIDFNSLEQKIIQTKTKMDVITPEIEIINSNFKPISKEYSADIREMIDYNITNQSYSVGKVKDFIAMFQDKFESTQQMFKGRENLAPKPISKLKTVTKNKEVDVIAMVDKKWISKNGHLILELEDMEARCIGVAMKDDKKIFEFAKNVLPDNVIAVKAVKATDEMIIIKEIFFPELPQRGVKKAERDLAACVISDIHVGSKQFLEKEFYKFLSWLKGDCSDKEKKKVGKIKYLFVLGDNVDGIGVYPDQIDNLAIKNIYTQYEAFTDIMKLIPEHIEVIIIPGQHDASRRNEPQPAIPKEYVKELYELGNFHFLSSPGWVEVEGLKTLMYHCSSMHDMIESVNNLSNDKPATAMIEYLKRRNLMPTYGMKNPYVPEKKDYMLIREPPDLFLGGDLHHNDFALHRGTMVVSGGTWQERTDFEVRIGNIPTPGICTTIELKTSNVSFTSFYKQQKYLGFEVTSYE